MSSNEYGGSDDAGEYVGVGVGIGETYLGDEYVTLEVN